jgi:hypothetical protein
MSSFLDILILLAFYFYYLCWLPWSKFLSYALGTPLNFTIFSHYENSLNIYFKTLLNDFIILYYIILYRMLEMPIACTSLSCL